MCWVWQQELHVDTNVPSAESALPRSDPGCRGNAPSTVVSHFLVQTVPAVDGSPSE